MNPANWNAQESYDYWYDPESKQVPEYAGLDTEELAMMHDLYPTASMVVLYKKAGVYDVSLPEFHLCAVTNTACHNRRVIYWLECPEWTQGGQWVPAEDISAVYWRQESK